MKTTYTISATALFTMYSFVSFSNELDSASTTLQIEVIEITQPTCNGKSDGSATVKVRGGQAPYTYSWNSYPEQKNLTAINLKSGIYFFEVKDASGRIAFRSVEIKDPIQTNILRSTGHVNPTTQIEIITPTNQTVDYYSTLNGNLNNQPIIHDLDVGIHKLVFTNNDCVVVQFIQIIQLENQEKTEVVLTPLEVSEINSDQVAGLK